MASKTVVPLFSVSVQLASKIVVPSNKFGAQFAVIPSNKIGVVFELQSCRTAPAGIIKVRNPGFALHTCYSMTHPNTVCIFVHRADAYLEGLQARHINNFK